MQYNKISVIGLGYIGLPTAAVIASCQKSVIGVDISQHVVDTINAGNIHIVEPELNSIVKTVVRDKLLRATTTPEPADAFLICVPTPFKENHQPDLSYIESAAKAIAPVLKKDNIVILESTSPVGATEQMSAWLAEARVDLTFPQTHGEDSDIRIAYCPERVLPGHVIQELIQNDRIIGGITPACSKAAVKLYQIFVEGECCTTDVRTAEMAKLVENSSRDVNIAFANELSVICDKLNISVWELIELANRHPRVNVLQPGVGVGGHCLAVDPWFIVANSPRETRLIQTARAVNDSKPEWVLKKIIDAVEEYSKSRNATPRISVLGLSYKPNSDDMRESPSLWIARQFEKHYKEAMMIVEPNISKLPEGFTSSRLENFEDVLQKSDIIITLVKHDEFQNIQDKIDREKCVLIDFTGVK